MFKKITAFGQHLIPQQALSRFAGWVAERRTSWFKNWVIRNFVRRYKVDLSIAASARIEDYPTFNAFFTRALRRGVRPIVLAADVVTSPVDGCISQIGSILAQTLVQAKGRQYSLNALLGNQQAMLPDFTGGNFATFYLSPKDYHRVHMPFAGRLTQTIYIPGKLFSVSPSAVESVPGLFTRNERLVCIFDTVAGPMAVILIGATLVGKLETVWGLVEKSRKIVVRDYNAGEAIELIKGEELGRFNMGSSVIILFAENKLSWVPGLHAQSEVHMGQFIGVVTNS